MIQSAELAGVNDLLGRLRLFVIQMGQLNMQHFTAAPGRLHHSQAICIRAGDRLFTIHVLPCL
ncbi:hypothetical protein D3C77_379170 [compost metagenome]